MATELDGQELRKKAEKRVEAVQGFKQNLIAYLVVNAFIFVVWLVIALAGGGWFPWFLFPLGGWGIGVAFHAWAVFGWDRYGGRHEELVQQEMERIRAEQPGATDREQE